MVLVDTSIWIDYLGSGPGRKTARFDELIASGVPFALTAVILQEILQGARSPRELSRLERNLLTQRFLHPRDPIKTYVAAAELYSRCRRAGVTPRGTVDCLIAQIAIEHDVPLHHADADFDRMAGVVRELRIY